MIGLGWLAVELDLSLTAAELTARLVDIESVSGNERPLADAIAAAISGLRHLTVHRDGNAIVASTDFGRQERVVLAGHIDTVPVAGNLPSHRDGDLLFGCGSCDMKSGVAVQLRLAAQLTSAPATSPTCSMTARRSRPSATGCCGSAAISPELLAADFAVLMEPTAAAVEGGCQGTLRAEVAARGERAHSARSWLGSNAIHAAGGILDVLRAYQARQPVVDGLAYHEGLNAVGISGGVAGNVIPDACVVTVNFRFAPDRSPEQAADHVRDTFAGFDVQITDSASGARPGLSKPAAASFVAAMGGEPRAKLGWTDVARFDALGIPAVNYGPGDPVLAHRRDEHVPLPQIAECEARMVAWLAQ